MSCCHSISTFVNGTAQIEKSLQASKFLTNLRCSQQFEEDHSFYLLTQSVDGMLVEIVELNVLVAEDVWVWCSSLLIFI